MQMHPSAICVQRFDDSFNPAIHITYRISLRSSSLPEPRDPSLRGVDIGSHSSTLGTRSACIISYGKNGIVSNGSRKNPAERGKQNQNGLCCF